MTETSWAELAGGAGQPAMVAFAVALLVAGGMCVPVSKGTRVPLPGFLVVPLGLLAAAPFMGLSIAEVPSGVEALGVHASGLRVMALTSWLAAWACALSLWGLSIAGARSAKEYPTWRRSFGVIPGVVAGLGGLVLATAAVVAGVRWEAAMPMWVGGVAGIGAAPVAMRLTESSVEREHIVRVRGAVATLMLVSVAAAWVGVLHFRKALELELTASGGLSQGGLFGLETAVPLWPGVGAAVLAILAAAAMSAMAVDRLQSGMGAATAAASLGLIVGGLGAPFAVSGTATALRNTWERTDLQSATASLDLPALNGAPGTMEWPVQGDCLWEVQEKSWKVLSLSGRGCKEADHPLAAADDALLAVQGDLSVRSLFHKGKDATVRIVARVPEAGPGPLGARTDLRAATITIASTLVEERTRKSVLYVIEQAGGLVRIGDPVDGFKDLDEGEGRVAALSAAAAGRERVALIPGPGWTVADMLALCRDMSNPEAQCALVPAARSQRVIDMAMPSASDGPVAREKRVVGAMEVATLDEALTGLYDSYAGCYLREAALKRDLAGSVVLDFQILEDGTTSDVALKDSDLPGNIGECLVREFAKLELPKPSQGAVLVTWPLVFEARPLPQ